MTGLMVLLSHRETCLDRCLNDHTAEACDLRGKDDRAGGFSRQRYRNLWDRQLRRQAH